MSMNPSAASVMAGQKRSVMAAAGKPFAPATFFAGMGIFWLLVLAALWGTWLLTGKAHPVDPGPTPLPEWMWYSLRCAELFYTLATFYAMYALIWKPWKREKRLTFDGMLVIGFYVMWALADPWATYLAPLYSYNAYSINLGCPQCQIFGAVSPNWSTHYVEPLALIGLYGAGLTAGTLVACWVMRKVHAHWPQVNKIAMFLILMPVMVVADMLLEIPMQVAGLWSYVNAVPDLTLFYGTYYQYPIYEGLLMWVMWGGFAFMRYYKNDRGETLVERGLSDMKLSDGQRTRKRLLAVIGGICTIAVMAYHLPFQFIAIHTNDVPRDILERSYFLHGTCGPATERACPDGRVPVSPRPQSAYVTPDGKFVAPAGLPDQVNHTTIATPEIVGRQ